MVTQADSTLDQIKQKVRRLTMSGDASVLSDSEIERQINTFIEQDFPYSLRINEFIERRSFYTQQGVDRYTVDINTVRTLKMPAIVSGKYADWFQDFNQFNALFPKSYESMTSSGDGTSGAYSLTVSSLPLLRSEVVVSAIRSDNIQEVFQDDGSGTMITQLTGSAGTGTVDYSTATISVTFGNTINSGATITFQYVPVQQNKPNAVFFRNNEIILRPVPDATYKVEYDAYIIPVAFIATNQSPKLNYWWEYIAYGAAIKILQDRQDVESLSVLMPTFKEKETIIVEQTAIQDENMRSNTIYVNNSPYNRGNYYDGIY